MMDNTTKGEIKNIIFYWIRVALLGLLFNLILINVEIIDYYFQSVYRNGFSYEANIKDMIVPRLLLVIVIILIFFCNHLFNKKSYSYSDKISIKIQSLLWWLLAIIPSFIVGFFSCIYFGLVLYIQLGILCQEVNDTL